MNFFNRALLLRFFVTASAYGITTAVLIIVLIFLKGRLDPQALQAVLSYIFISNIISGLQPGTATAQFLRDKQKKTSYCVTYPWIFIGSSVKAILASPFLIVLWYFTQSKGWGSLIIWTPIIAIVGFMTTDLRTVFDVNGRYAAAIWLKQGSLSIGLFIIALVMVAGFSPHYAIPLSLAARAAWLFTFTSLGRPYLKNARLSKKIIYLELNSRRWIDIASISVFSALGGSIDRLVALRYLPTTDSNGYFILYEVLSKFLIISYLLSPIVFSKRIRHDTSNFLRKYLFVILSFGIMFFIICCFFSILFSVEIFRNLGTSFNIRIVALFSAAIVVNGIVQLLIANMQGCGLTREVFYFSILSMSLATLSFFLLTSNFHLAGLIAAWLVKGILELILIFGLKIYLSLKYSKNSGSNLQIKF